MVQFLSTWFITTCIFDRFYETLFYFVLFRSPNSVGENILTNVFEIKTKRNVYECFFKLVKTIFVVFVSNIITVKKCIFLLNQTKIICLVFFQYKHDYSNLSPIAFLPSWACPRCSVDSDHKIINNINPFARVADNDSTSSRSHVKRVDFRIVIRHALAEYNEKMQHVHPNIYSIANLVASIQNLIRIFYLYNVRKRHGNMYTEKCILNL